MLNLKDISGLPVIPEAALEHYTTFQLGGPCAGLIPCERPEELEHAVKILNRRCIPFILIGGGSNLVVSDQGIDFVVIRYHTQSPQIEHAATEVIVSGSTRLDDLALYTAKNGLQGLGWTSGIPGTVGGAIVGNAGAFGRQVGDVLAAVTLISPDGSKKEALAGELGFRYRHSNLKESGDLVLTARFNVSKGDRNALLKEREEILSLRHAKHPDLGTYPCAGSFFRNIEPTSAAGHRQAAGWFLEQAGGKELRCGGAVIFEKHANIIVKSKGCTALDVYHLSEKMKQLVKEKFDLELVREVRFVGRFDGVPSSSYRIIW